ncbi:MAG: hypothetical protein ACHQX1_03610, partial [Candidatus Micrarchaeales archaeon]
IIAIVVGLFAIACIYPLNAVLILENNSIINSIKRSIDIGRKNIISILALLFFGFIIALILAIGEGIVGLIIGFIPIIGTGLSQALSQLFSSFLSAWFAIVVVVFYHQYVLGDKDKAQKAKPAGKAPEFYQFEMSRNIWIVIIAAIIVITASESYAISVAGQYLGPGLNPFSNLGALGNGAYPSNYNGSLFTTSTPYHQTNPIAPTTIVSTSSTTIPMPTTTISNANGYSYAGTYNNVSVSLAYTANKNVESFPDSQVVGYLTNFYTNDPGHSCMDGYQLPVYSAPSEYPGYLVVHGGGCSYITLLLKSS